MADVTRFTDAKPAHNLAARSEGGRYAHRSAWCAATMSARLVNRKS